MALGRVASRQQRTNLFEQARDCDRLGVEFVAARSESLLAVTGHRIGRQGDDGNVPCLLCSLDLARRLPSIEHGQAQIHQNHIGPLDCRKLHTAGAIARNYHGMAVALEALLQDEDVVLIVLYIQDFHARISLTFACWPRSIERGSIRPSSRSSSSRSEAFFRITCSTYPFSRFWSSTLRSLAVKTSTGMSRQSGRWRISTRNSNPSISGITRSSTITSGDDSASCSSAKRPLLAPATCPFSCSSTRRTPSRMLSSSSTSRTLRAIGLLMFCSSLMRRSRSIGLVMYSVAPSE